MIEVAILQRSPGWINSLYIFAIAFFSLTIISFQQAIGKKYEVDG
jgi:hypothetical protein